jgi:hypothetical protein
MRGKCVDSQSQTFPDRRPATAPIVWICRLLLFGGLLGVAIQGDPLARAIAIAGMLFGALGDRDGLARHIVRMLGFVLAAVLAPAFGPRVGQAAAAALGSATPYAGMFGVIGLALLTVLVIGFLGRLIGAALRRQRALGSADRILGGALGAAEGALVVAAFCWGVGVMREPLSSGPPSDPAAPAPVLVRGMQSMLDLLDTTPTGRALAAHNPLQDVPILTDAAETLEALADPRRQAALAEAPAWKSFCDNPAVQRHLENFRNDPALKAAAESRDISRILSSRALAQMAADPEVYAAVSQHWEALRAAVHEAPK